MRPTLAPSIDWQVPQVCRAHVQRKDSRQISKLSLQPCIAPWQHEQRVAGQQRGPELVWVALCSAPSYNIVSALTLTSASAHVVGSRRAQQRPTPCKRIGRQHVQSCASLSPAAVAAATLVTAFLPWNGCDSGGFYSTGGLCAKPACAMRVHTLCQRQCCSMSLASPIRRQTRPWLSAYVPASCSC